MEQNRVDKPSKSEIAIFFLVTFGMSLFWGIIMYFGIYKNSYNISMFMMLVPAAGVALGKIHTKSEDKGIKQIHKIEITAFGTIFLVLLIRTAGVITDALLTGCITIMGVVASMIAILYSWVYSSQFNPAKNIKEIVKFILGYTVITLAVIIWMNFSRIDIFLFQGVLFSLFTFMISGIFYFGEEYGWRGYLQPLLQDKFGKRWGVILVGILWQIWHIPFYYPDVNWNLKVMITRFLYLPALSVVFGYVYMKTENIWAVAFLHLISNVITVYLPKNTDKHYLPGLLFLSCIWFLLLFTKEYRNTNQKTP